MKPRINKLNFLFGKRFLALMLGLSLCLGSLSAQNDVYVPPGGGVGFFQDTTVIYGKMTVDGGTMYFAPGSNVVFYGDSFKIIAGSSTGSGKVIFKGPRINIAPGSFTQYLDADGVKLGGMLIDNALDVHLANTNAGVLDTLRFANGKLFLNLNDFTVGNGSPGVIDGYTENRFVVTNGTNAINDGYLIRENVGTALQVFPIGPHGGAYEPAALSNNGTLDNFRMRIGIGVEEFVSSGSQQNDRSTQNTWFVEEGTAGGSDANLYLQHNTWHEGGWFYAMRPTHFISRYVGFSPNTEGDTISYTNWDNFGRASTQPGVAPGYLTTGTAITGAIVSERLNLKYFGPFAKTVWNAPWMVVPLPIDFLGINAVWKSDQIASVSWKVDNDEQAKSYTVERSLPGDKKFTAIKTVNAKKETGLVTYAIDDNLANVTGTILYRIVGIEENGKTYTSGIAKLFKKGANAGIMLAPNPATNWVDISTFGGTVGDDALDVSVHSQTGALIYHFSDPSGQNIRINTSNWSEGIYVVQIRHGEQIQTEKLMVLKNN